MPAEPRRFTFTRCLGRGSFGEVYAATMRSPGGLESPVAVKLLRKDVELGGEAVQRLRDEGRLLARLNHPAILTVFDLVTLRGRLALITEHVDGADLSDCIRDGGIPTRALLQALGQVAGALDAAYGAPGPDGPLKLVHRDVKPSNIRIDRHGQAKLLDFGIARFDASDREVRTASDLVVGSVPFMAPERFVRREVEPSSDVFSLGCTLYEGLTNERFYGSSNVAKITGLALDPERYREVTEARLETLRVAGGVRQLLTDLVALEPRARPSAARTAARLERLADQIGGPTLRMWCRDREWWTQTELEGELTGETLIEGEASAETRSTSGRDTPMVIREPRETIEPGRSALELGAPATEPTDAAPPSLPERKDSTWDRPYTHEAERPLSPRLSESTAPQRSGAGMLVGIALAGIGVVLVGVIGLAALAIVGPVLVYLVLAA